MARTARGTAKTESKSSLQAIHGGLTITEKAAHRVNKEAEAKPVNLDVETVKGEVVAEFTQQLAGAGLFIYNARYPDATIIVENLGLGDVYAGSEPDIYVGDESKRLIFKDQRIIQGNKVFIISASEPVVSIIEIKQ
jgi:hypothetical protein